MMVNVRGTEEGPIRNSLGARCVLMVFSGTASGGWRHSQVGHVTSVTEAKSSSLVPHQWKIQAIEEEKKEVKKTVAQAEIPSNPTLFSSGASPQ